MHDDTYFYFQVAHNIVTGNGSTFNQVTPTNGYHPLWQVICVALYFIGGNDKGVFLHFVTLVSALMTVGIILLYYRLLKNISIQYWHIPLVSVGVYFFNGMQGSEAQLNGLLLCAGLIMFERALALDRLSTWAFAAACFSLAILARLDNVFVVTTLFLAALPSVLQSDARRVAGWLVAVSVPTVALLLPYLMWNQSEYGSPMPISGAIKSLFPEPSFLWGRLSPLARIVAAFAVLGLATAGFGRSLETRLRLILLGLGCGVLLHVGYIGFFTIGTQWNWYYVSGYINATLVVAAVIKLAAPVVSKLISERHYRSAVIAIAALLTVLGTSRAWYKWHVQDGIGADTFGLHARKEVPNSKHIYDMIRFIKSDLPQDSRIFMWDVPGIYAYFSERNIVPADGLMNDFQYNDELVVKGIVTYLREKNIAYYIGPVDEAITGLINGPQTAEELRLVGEILAKAQTFEGRVTELNVFSPLYRIPVGKLALDRSELIYTTGGDEEKLGLWRLNLATPDKTGQ